VVKVRNVVFVGLLAVSLALAAGGSALARSREAAANQATEIGVTPTTIRIAVVADVDNAIVPGVLQGVVDGVNGFGKYVNANGGLAGRKVQVDFIDSKLSPTAARDAVIQACQ
jgi:hypothetical protein